MDRKDHESSKDFGKSMGSRKQVSFLLSCRLRLRRMFVCISFSRVQLFVTLWVVACQFPLSMGFSKQKYWSRLPIPLPGDLPDPGIKAMSPMSPALAGGSFTTSGLGRRVIFFPDSFGHGDFLVWLCVPLGILSAEPPQSLFPWGKYGYFSLGSS